MILLGKMKRSLSRFHAARNWRILHALADDYAAKAMQLYRHIHCAVTEESPPCDK